MVMVIVPPQAHMQVEVLVRAGMPPTVTVGDPGAHGATVFGTHGMGVSTPEAEAVADATVGFKRDEHMPNVGMFTMGAKSLMVAAGMFAHMMPVAGRTVSVPGVVPNGHIRLAPLTTRIGISAPLPREREAGHQRRSD
jgi:hypothetical protein